MPFTLADVFKSPLGLANPVLPGPSLAFSALIFTASRLRIELLQKNTWG